jgi:hypothetical protein
MEQIARDMREGTFPKKSDQTQREDAASAAQAALNPGMREALERIRDFPTGGHTAAGAMALIARQALASLPPSQ